MNELRTTHSTMPTKAVQSVQRRNTETRRSRTERYGGCEKSHESHASRTYKERHKLIAQKSYQHVEALHSTKDDGRLEYM